MLKSERVNAIVKAFGGNVFLPIVRKEKKTQNPENLVQICTNFVKGAHFPVEHIQIPLATVVQMETSDTWKANVTVNMKTVIPNMEKKEIELFSYPELSMSRSQLEFHTFDFMHILTNLRTQILTRGLDSCPKKHFEELSETQPDILSLAAVFDKIDQQNAFTAMRMFNCDVETFMHSKGYVETADFIK